MGTVNVFDQFDDPTPKAAPAAAAPSGPNVFDQFDAKPTAPAAAPTAAASDPANPPRTLMGRILDAIHPIVSGVNSGAADLAGLPMDAANSATNTVRHALGGVSQLVTGQPSSLMQDPDAASVPGTSANLKALSEKVLPGTMNDTAHPIQHALGELVGPGGAAALAAHAASLVPELASVVGAPSDAAPLQTARGLGFKTTASNVALTNPTQKSGILNQTGEVLSGGNSAITRANQTDNTARATQLVGDQLGLGPNVTKINVPDLAKAKVAPAADYDATAGKVGDFAPSPNLTNLLSDAQSDMSPQAAPASRTASKNILQTIAANGGKYSGSDAVGDISALRENQSTRPIADMLQDEMGRQLEAQGDGAALTKYTNARRQFAQIFAAQDALRGGQIDPQALLAADPKLQFLTGNLRGVASAANELPNDVRLPDSTPEGTLDAILGKTKGIAGSIVRPLMRSNLVQNQFGPEANAGGQSYFKTYGLPPGADEPPPPSPLKLALAPGRAGRVMPSEGGPHGAQIEAPVPQNPRPLIDLAPAEGQVGRPTPVQGGMPLPQGPETISGAPPSTLAGNSLVRPLGEAFQPHQHDLFPPNNVSVPKPAPKGKPAGLSDSDWKLLNSLGLGE